LLIFIFGMIFGCCLIVMNCQLRNIDNP